MLIVQIVAIQKYWVEFYQKPNDAVRFNQVTSYNDMEPCETLLIFWTQNTQLTITHTLSWKKHADVVILVLVPIKNKKLTSCA